MNEASKAILRRVHDIRFATRYFVGNGVDIGAGRDVLEQYIELFPQMRACRRWDVEDGDAQYLATLEDASFDFVHSSHCLEHLQNPREALGNWLRVLKPGGHLIVTIPDEDMYEQGKFPSSFNDGHLWTFTMCKAASWSESSINLLPLLTEFPAIAQVIKAEQLDAAFRYDLPRFDQTLTPVAESGIEFIMRKLTPEELSQKGRLPK